MTHSRLRIGLVVNPWAGVGGPTGLRGSDGVAIRDEALARGAIPRAGERALAFLRALHACRERILLRVWGGPMGEAWARAADIPADVAGTPQQDPSSPDDTREAVRALAVSGLDLLVFVGGDGTARDVCDAIGDSLPALGVPAGVKMYSGVFAVSPEAAAEVVCRLAAGRPVTISEADVRDIDEEAFRQDRVTSRRYGSLRVPGVRGFLQNVKCGGREDEAVAQQEIGAWVAETMEEGVLYLVGTGTTPRAVMTALGLPSSLLGFDAVLDRRLAGADLDAAAMRALVAAHPHVKILVTATGGQGFLLGRGNQQLAADIVERAGTANLVILATRSKLDGLAGRPLLVDSGDPALDRALSGLRPVITGYDHTVLCRVAAAADVAGTENTAD